jgi:excisionase family DNA binding protein
MRTKSPPSSLLLTPQKAADYLGYARSTLRKLLKAGKIKAKIEGGRRYFVAASLQAYVESLPDA